MKFSRWMYAAKLVEKDKAGSLNRKSASSRWRLCLLPIADSKTTESRKESVLFLIVSSKYFLCLSIKSKKFISFDFAATMNIMATSVGSIWPLLKRTSYTFYT